MPDILSIFLVAWLFCVGAAIGSFVNVVVLRMPAGVSIATSGSRCPYCRHAIRWWDNIPLVSWLMLSGRCRDCGAPISLRYPLVELLIAGMFLAVALATGFSGGITLPRPEGAPAYWHPATADLWTTCALHGVLLATLACCAIMEWDRHRIPPVVFLPALAAAAALPFAMPNLRPLPAWAMGMADAPAWMRPLVDALAGLGLGTLAGVATWPATQRVIPGPAGHHTATLAAALCGVSLGWQAGTVVVAATSLAMMGTAFVARGVPAWRRIPWLSALTALTLLFMISWRVWDRVAPELARRMSLPVWGVLLFVTLAGALVTRRMWLEPCVGRTDRKRGPMEPVSPEANAAAIHAAPSYRLAELDTEFLQRPELRPVRLQLELLKPEMLLNQHQIQSTIVVFGGTQIADRSRAEKRLANARCRLAEAPGESERLREVTRAERLVGKAHYYDAAREFSQIVSTTCQIDGNCDFVIITGGGSGIMEAANRGAFDSGAKSIGLNITLPAEQQPNPYITPDLCFQFHYFALRKMHFLLRARALVVFPGGFGTLDELFDALTLRQTHCMQRIPILLFGREYWSRVIDFQFLADEGVIADADLKLLDYAETPQEAWDKIQQFHRENGPSP